MKEIEEIEKIAPPKLNRSMKNRQTRFIKFLKNLSGVSEDFLGPYQPERLNEKTSKEDAIV